MPLTSFDILLLTAHLIVFGIALTITITSLRAYLDDHTPYLRNVFIGFAFITVGVSFDDVLRHIFELDTVILELAETVPLMLGFGFLFIALYR